MAAVSPRVQAPDLVPVGIVLYDNPDAPDEGGWACSLPEEPNRIRAPADLASDVVWVTNSSSNSFWTARQNSVHNLRHDGFFRTTLRQIVSDLGHRADAMRAPDQARLLAEIAGRAVRIANAGYPWPSGRAGLDGRTFAEEVRGLMPADPAVPPRVKPPLMMAFQKDSMVPMPWMESQIHITLRYNRVAHAERVLSTPVPTSAWEWLNPEDMPPSQKRRVDFLLSQDRPVLAEVNVRVDHLVPEEGACVAFGVTYNRRSMVRRWVSHPELLWLSRIADVEVQSAVIGAEYKLLPEVYQLPKAITRDALVRASYSAGLVAEAHWTSLASEVYVRRQTEVSPRAVWLRATDRGLCFSSAMRAVRAGFSVSGYGNGSIGVRIENHKDSLQRLADFALKEGFVCPVFTQMANYVG